MTITYQAQDSDEPIHDTDAEQWGNQLNYQVTNGCAVTYDSGNLTIDIAAGNILHNGSLVSVAGGSNELTLVADSSNERWSYITESSGGTAVLVSGTAAASSAVEPAKPEAGDRVILAMVKIEAGQTVANDIAVKLDKRILGPTAFRVGGQLTVVGNVGIGGTPATVTPVRIHVADIGNNTDTGVGLDFASASSEATANLAEFYGMRLPAITVTGNSGTRTMTKASTLVIKGPPVAGTNAAITSAFALSLPSGALEASNGAGTSGEQLATAGSNANLSWASASSLREFKVVGHERTDYTEALALFVNATVHDFKYPQPEYEEIEQWEQEGDNEPQLVKRQVRVNRMPSTGDFDTTYTGVMGDDLPEFMHHDGKILNPINVLGYTALAFKAIDARLTAGGL